MEQGDLDWLAEKRPDESAIRQRLEESLPFHMRSTFGGHTSCIEIETSDALLILDAGSGLRDLGMELSRRWNAADYAGPRAAHVLLTHGHTDHTHSTPFIDPYYDKRNHFKIWASQSALDSLHAVLSPDAALRSVFFPTTYQHMAGIKQFQAIEAGQRFSIGGTQISTHALHHPGGCPGLPVRAGGAPHCFRVGSRAPGNAGPGAAEFAQDADLLYLDAQYLADEYEGRIGIGDEPPCRRVGWGHSTVEAAVATAAAANARRLHLGHHEPKRSDEGWAGSNSTPSSAPPKHRSIAARFPLTVPRSRGS